MTDQIQMLLEEQAEIWAEQETDWAGLETPMLPAGIRRNGVEQRDEEETAAGRGERSRKGRNQPEAPAVGPSWLVPGRRQEGRLEAEGRARGAAAAGEPGETEKRPEQAAAGRTAERVWETAGGLYGAVRRAAETAWYVQGVRREPGNRSERWAEDRERPGLEDWDRAIQRDARRYDGSFALF